MSDNKKKKKDELPKVLLEVDPRILRCGCSRAIAAKQKKAKEAK